MGKLKLGVISLGCDKNTIDTEMFLGSIVDKFDITLKKDEAEVIIINTCSFIESAKQESIDMILETAELKKKNLKVLVVTGCLSKRYGKELIELIPEIDIVLGVMNYERLYEYIIEFIEVGNKIIDNSNRENTIFEAERIVTTPKHYAYLKISEGCNNACTFCIIPKIRGRHVSRSIESLVQEAKSLVESGVSELILIAQDTTKYGEDLYGEKRIVDLIRELSKIDGIRWIRIHYSYPEDINEALINEFKQNSKLCKYVDIPLQHVSDSILKNMARHTREEKIYALIHKLKEIENMVIRTSLIVGFPGETEEDFLSLKNFISKGYIDNVGVFCYSQEEDTVAATFDNQIDEDVKKYRYNEIMRLQKEVSRRIISSKIGQVFDVVIDSKNKDGYIGRLNFQSPGIDGIIYVNSNHNLSIGQFVKVKIISSLDYDYVGETI